MAEPAPAQEPPKSAKAEPKQRKPKVVATAEAPAAPLSNAVALTAASDPPGAEVVARWEGGEKRGKAPLHFDVPRGSKVKLVFSLKGYSPSDEEVTAEDARTVTAELVQLLGD